MASWDPSKFSNARVSADRRYVSSPALPDNNSANAGQIQLREGERVAGFRPDKSRDLLDALPKGGAISDEALEGRARGINEIRRGDVRDILGSTLFQEMGLAAPIKRGEMMGAQQLQVVGVSGAVRSAGGAGTVPAQSTAALWGGPMAPQEPTAWVGRQEPTTWASTQAPTASTTASQVFPLGAAWQRTGVPTPLALGEQADANMKRIGMAGGLELGAANRGRAPLSEHDERVAVNGMADFNEFEGAYPEGDLGMGAPRRLDLGIMTEHPSQTVAWRGLVTKDDSGPALAMTGNRVGASNTAQGMAGDARARRLAANNPAVSHDAMWSDGTFGMGSGVDAVFTGVFVDPYTGIEYDTYENEAPAPTGDYRQRDSGAQRAYESLMGGAAPGRPQRKKTEQVNDWSEVMPDVDERDWVEYARLRGMEAGRREEFFGPHTDEAAWKDGEGYKSLPKRDVPFNKNGFNDAVRFPAMPALHLHGGLRAAPMTGGGVDPGDGAGVPSAGSMPPEIAVRVKKAPVFSVHGGVGGSHMEGTFMGALAEQRDPLRAHVRIGEYGEHVVGGDHLQGAFTGGLAEQRDPLRAPVRIGEHGQYFADGMAVAGEGAFMGGLSEHRDPLRAPVRIGEHGQYFADGMAVAGEGAFMGGLSEHRDPLRAPVRIGEHGQYFADGMALGGEGAYQPPQDMLTHTLSHRPHLVQALGRAFTNIMTGVDGNTMPPESFPETLRVMANNPMSMGRAIIDLGLAGPSTAGMSDFSNHKVTHRMDMRAMAIGDVGFALVSGLDNGAYMPPELYDLKPQERDAVTLALGRAIIHMIDGAAVAGGAPAMPADTYEEVRREPAFIEAMGRLAIQLTDDAGGAYVPPDDWAAAQSKDRAMPERSKTAWARELGRHLVNVASEVEATGTLGLTQFRNPLRADAIINAILGRGVDTEVNGASTIMLADPDAVRKRKLDQYAIALAARVYGLNANAEDMGLGTGGLVEWTRHSRARNDRPNLRGSAPFRVVDGHDGLPVHTDMFLRTSRIRNDTGPNKHTIVADAMQTAAPTRDTEWTRKGHRVGGFSVPLRADHFGGSGFSSAFQEDYTNVDSKFMEVAQ